MADTFLSPAWDYEAVATFCGVTDSSRDDFRRAVDSAAAGVRTACGPVLLETGLAHTTRSTSGAVVLPFRVAALASITASGAALDVADFYVEPHHLGGHGGQVVRRVDGGPIPACTVVYSSGWAQEDIPLDLVGAGFEIARQHWRSTLGNQRTGDEQQQRSWSVTALVDRYIPADWRLASLGFA